MRLKTVLGSFTSNDTGLAPQELLKLCHTALDGLRRAPSVSSDQDYECVKNWLFELQNAAETAADFQMLAEVQQAYIEFAVVAALDAHYCAIETGNIFLRHSARASEMSFVCQRLKEVHQRLAVEQCSSVTGENVTIILERAQSLQNLVLREVEKHSPYTDGFTLDKFLSALAWFMDVAIVRLWKKSVSEVRIREQTLELMAIAIENAKGHISRFAFLADWDKMVATMYAARALSFTLAEEPNSELSVLLERVRKAGDLHNYSECKRGLQSAADRVIALRGEIF